VPVSSAQNGQLSLKSYNHIPTNISVYHTRPTNSIQQNPSWEANSHSVKKFTFYEIWRFINCVHKKLPLVLNLSLMNPVHTIKSCFFKNHSNIILPPASRYSSQNSACISHLHHACYMSHFHPLWFDFPNNWCYFHPLRSKYSPQYPAIKHLQYTLNMRDQGRK